MSADQAIMRTSLLPNLLAAIARNRSFGRADVALFEVGSVFLRKPGQPATGPITDLAGLKVTAAGTALPWRRDDVDMYAFRVTVPEGADAVEVTLDVLTPATTSGFSSRTEDTMSVPLVASPTT